MPKRLAKVKSLSWYMKLEGCLSEANGDHLGWGGENT